MRNFLLAGLAAIAVSSVAHAGPVSYQVYDGSTLISTPATNNSGLLPFSASDANFYMSGVVSGYPTLVSPTFSSQSFTLNSTGAAGTVTIKVTDTNLLAFTGPLQNSFTLNALVGGGFTSGTITNYVDASNAAFGTATQLASTGSVTQAMASPLPFTSTGVSPISMIAPFSETTVYTLNYASGAASTISASSQLQSVPEPATLAVLGTALAGLGVLRRRRRV